MAGIFTLTLTIFFVFQLTGILTLTLAAFLFSK
jgi:hypothetical protein